MSAAALKMRRGSSSMNVAQHRLSKGRETRCVCGFENKICSFNNIAQNYEIFINFIFLFLITARNKRGA